MTMLIMKREAKKMRHFNTQQWIVELPYREAMWERKKKRR